MFYHTSASLKTLSEQSLLEKFARVSCQYTCDTPDTWQGTQPRGILSLYTSICTKGKVRYKTSREIENLLFGINIFHPQTCSVTHICQSCRVFCHLIPRTESINNIGTCQWWQSWHKTHPRIKLNFILSRLSLPLPISHLSSPSVFEFYSIGGGLEMVESV